MGSRSGERGYARSSLPTGVNDLKINFSDRSPADLPQRNQPHRFRVIFPIKDPSLTMLPLTAWKWVRQRGLCPFCRVPKLRLEGQADLTKVSNGAPWRTRLPAARSIMVFSVYFSPITLLLELKCTHGLADVSSVGWKGRRRKSLFLCPGMFQWFQLWLQFMTAGIFCLFIFF